MPEDSDVGRRSDTHSDAPIVHTRTEVKQLSSSNAVASRRAVITVVKGVSIKL
jgi:hypothetical protein